jgi:hypothetical protein
MATSYGKLIDDETDPPGEARPGPVYARAEVDREPWTGSPYQRRNAGVYPSWLCGERSFQRSYPPKFPDDDYRLCRAYLDQSQHSQVAMLALGIDWQRNHSDEGEWPVRYADRIKSRFGVGVFAGLSQDERDNIYRAWQTKSVVDVKRVMPYLDGFLFDRSWTLCSHDNGSGWSLMNDGGRTSTASTEASMFDAELHESGWLAANNGMRDADEKSDDIVSTQGWEDGSRLCSKRSDERYGVRSLQKPSGVERWRIEFSRECNRLVLPGQAPHDEEGPIEIEHPQEEGGQEVPENSEWAQLADDGNPIAYHKMTALLVGVMREWAMICSRLCLPDAKRFVVGLLRELANIIEKGV